MDSKERNRLHRRKILPVIIITVILITYFAIYFGVMIAQMQNTVLKWLLGIIPALLGAVMIGLCVQRIKEIKGGEEDDLSQY